MCRHIYDLNSLNKIFLYSWDVTILGFSHPNYKVQEVETGMWIIDGFSSRAFCFVLFFSFTTSLHKVDVTFSYLVVSFFFKS